MKKNILSFVNDRRLFPVWFVVLAAAFIYGLYAFFYTFLDWNDLLLVGLNALPDGDVSKRRAIINIFVNTVHLYDDRMTVIFNGAEKTVSRKDIPLDDIESAFADFSHGECSSMKTSAPPNVYRANTCFFHGGFAVTGFL